MTEGKPKVVRHALPLADNIEDIQPFYVMTMLEQAKRLEAQGRHIVHMEVGEPDFVTADTIIAAAHQALDEGRVHYTPATGLPELRGAIAQFYAQQYALSVASEQVIVTPGASGALLLLLTAVLNPGDEVLMTDPGYPCNKNFVRLRGATPVEIAVDERHNFQLTADLIREHWSDNTKLVMLASPANPTGTLVPEDELKKIADFVAQRNGWLLVDEIYHGLVYDAGIVSAAGINPNTIVINSFSKYFGMTGWRLGWLVAEPSLVGKLDILAQNMFLAAPTLAQYAALTAFSAPALAIMEQRRSMFQQRRDYLYAELAKLGFTLYGLPAGAFYIYAGCERFSQDSMAFCASLLNEAGVATAPGRDFGKHRAARHLRFAYTTSREELELGIQRIRSFLS